MQHGIQCNYDCVRTRRVPAPAGHAGRTKRCDRALPFERAEGVAVEDAAVPGAELVDVGTVVVGAVVTPGGAVERDGRG